MHHNGVHIRRSPYTLLPPSSSASEALSSFDVTAIPNSDFVTRSAEVSSLSPSLLASPPAPDAATEVSRGIFVPSKRMTLSTKAILVINGHRVSVRAYRLATAMSEATRKRLPEYHDMFININTFKLRGYIEVIENEINTVISIINSNKKRHLNLFRSLEGILYFLLHNQYNILLKKLYSLDSEKLYYLIFLFSSLWLYTLMGLYERKQLNERTVENLNIVINELNLLYKELNLLYQKPFEDIYTRLLIIVDSIISDELKIDITNRANLETHVLDEKWDINNQLKEWNNKFHHILGGETYNLTKWSYAKRYPYLLSTRSISSVEPPSPTPQHANLPVSPKMTAATTTAVKRSADVALTPPTSKRMHGQQQDMTTQQHLLTTQISSEISPKSLSVETPSAAIFPLAMASSVHSMPPSLPSSNLATPLLNDAAPAVDISVYGGSLGVTMQSQVTPLLPTQNVLQNISALQQPPPSSSMYSAYQQQQQQVLLPAHQIVTNISNPAMDMPTLYSLYNPGSYSLLPLPRQQLVSADMLPSAPPVPVRRPIRPIPHVPIRKGPFLQQLVPRVSSSPYFSNNLDSRYQLIAPI